MRDAAEPDVYSYVNKEQKRGTLRHFAGSGDATTPQLRRPSGSRWRPGEPSLAAMRVESTCDAMRLASRNSWRSIRSPDCIRLIPICRTSGKRWEPIMSHWSSESWSRLDCGLRCLEGFRACELRIIKSSGSPSDLCAWRSFTTARPKTRHTLLRMRLPARSPVVDALKRLGHRVTSMACTLDLAAIRRKLMRAKPDVVFNRVESLGGSDSMMAAITLLLDAMKIPYTGNSTAALVATASKVYVKERLHRAGLPTAGWISVDHGQLEQWQREVHPKICLRTRFVRAQ